MTSPLDNLPGQISQIRQGNKSGQLGDEVAAAAAAAFLIFAAWQIGKALRIHKAQTGEYMSPGVRAALVWAAIGLPSIWLMLSAGHEAWSLLSWPGLIIATVLSVRYYHWTTHRSMPPPASRPVQSRRVQSPQL